MGVTLPLLSLFAAISLSTGIYLVFFVAPTEATMGFVQKIFYFHVPAAWAMFLAVLVGAVASGVFLAKRHDGADHLAHACMELAAVFGLMVLVTGPLWGYETWGTPWEWDVRLTTFLVLELVLLAYLSIRAFAGSRARSLAAGLALFGVAQVPLVYFSVDLWRGQHPRVIAGGGLHPEMIGALLICIVGFMLLLASLLKLRLAMAEDAVLLDELHLFASELGMEDG